MDELSLLHAMRDRTPAASDAVIDNGRTKLLAHIDPPSAKAPQLPARSSSRFRLLSVLPGGRGNGGNANVGNVPSAPHRPGNVRRRVVLGSAAAAFLVGIVVAADVVLPNRPGATAEAAEVLHRAAAATVQTSDPVLGPNQYLKIETTAVYGASTGSSNGTSVSWREKVNEQLYVPADRAGEWVWNREERVPFEFSSEAAKAVEAEIRRAQPVEGRPQRFGVLRAMGGAFYGNEQKVIIGTPLSEADSLPKDPRALLNLIYERTKGSGKSPELEAFVTISDGLRAGAIPADTRSTLYTAAALITGVTVTDKQATVDGRTGVALGIPSLDGGSRQEIIIDPSSGLVIGERAVLQRDYPGEPAGTVVSWTSVRTSVVDSAP